MQTSPITLALELSQRHGSVAMMNKDGVIKCIEVESGSREKDELFPAIESISSSLQITPIDIELVVVSIGPGGFTGLRSAVSIAKMIALSANADIVAVESAVVTAVSSNKGQGPFIVISCIKRNQCWLSRVEKIEGNWTCNASITPIDIVQANLNGSKVVFVDEFLDEDVHGSLKKNSVEILSNTVQATALLTVGVEMYKAGVVCAPSALLPLYPGEPEAVRVWKERQAPPA